ncbi:patatin-like phospholipase family protein [Arthrobacter psychrolactophilus]
MNSTPFSTQLITQTLTALPASDATPHDRALVLGGGGATGNAWLIGVVAGLFEAAIDVTRADLIIGTSAGSTATAQITGASLPQLFAETLAPVPTAQAAPRPSVSIPTRTGDQIGRIRKLIDSAQGPEDMRRKMGAAALDMVAATDGSWQSQWRATVAARLPDREWPQQPVLITAIDAASGEPVVFNRHSGVELVDAIAASCASGLPYKIGDRHYLDGGFRRSSENADLAAGYSRVLVLSPLGGRTLHPPEWGMQLATQIEELSTTGSLVETIVPDTEAEYMFGANAMNLSMRPAAAQAGFEQGKTLARRISELWC